MANPSVANLAGLTKVQWLQLATYCKLEAQSFLRKYEIRRALVAADVVEIFSEEELKFLDKCRELFAFKQPELKNRKIQVELMRAESERLRLSQSSVSAPAETNEHFKLENAVKFFFFFFPNLSEDDPEWFSPILREQLIHMNCLRLCVASA